MHDVATVRVFRKLEQSGAMEVRGSAYNSTSVAAPTKSNDSAGASGQATGAARASHKNTPVSRETTFRFHANESKHPREYDDKYRTLTLQPDGTFTDYNEHLWDLKEDWVTEGVNRVVYAGTYTLDGPLPSGPHIELCYTRIVSKCTDVVMGRESLEADEPLEQPVTTSGTMSAGGRSVALKPFGGGGEAKPQTLEAGKGPHKVYGGEYS